jgi:hypothetical protein
MIAKALAAATGLHHGTGSSTVSLTQHPSRTSTLANSRDAFSRIKAMVTGVEIAGIILGSIPLIISGLEHYAEGIGTIEKWWRYKKELASLKRVFGAEYDRFLNTLEELLAGIVPDAALASLLMAPGGAGWGDAELNRKLQARLRNSYISYLETINDFSEVVSILKSKLELGSDGKVCLSTFIFVPSLCLCYPAAKMD